MADESFQREPPPVEARPAVPTDAIASRPSRPLRNGPILLGLGLGALSLLCFALCWAAPWGLISPEEQNNGGYPDGKAPSPSGKDMELRKLKELHFLREPMVRRHD